MGIKNYVGRVINGYYKKAIDLDFENRKIDLLKIISMKNGQKIFDFNQNNQINFDLNMEIQQLLKITGENSSGKAGPDFVSEPEVLSEQDVNLTASDVPTAIKSKRKIIDVAEYPMADEMVHEEKIKEEIGREELDTEILLDDSMAEYRETASNQLEQTEIVVNFGF